MRENLTCTLQEFSTQHHLMSGESAGLSALLQDIAEAGKNINAEIGRIGLSTLSKDAGLINVQGENVTNFDLFANAQMIGTLRKGGNCCGICSEEEKNIIVFDESPNSSFIVLFDPIDGSSNIDANISLGSIFSIYNKITDGDGLCSESDFLQCGDRQIAAGYILYGISTMFVYATKQGVNGFTLNTCTGEFYLTHPNIKSKTQRSYLSVNFALLPEFPQPVQEYLTGLQMMKSDFTLRYTGTLVADLHRNLIKGGIFLYPATEMFPQGKLRLMYECNPFTFIYCQAGCAAIDGHNNILELVPADLHQRSALYIGNKNIIKDVLKMNKN